MIARTTALGPVTVVVVWFSFDLSFLVLKVGSTSFTSFMATEAVLTHFLKGKGQIFTLHMTSCRRSLAHFKGKKAVVVSANYWSTSCISLVHIYRYQGFQLWVEPAFWHEGIPWTQFQINYQHQSK